MELPRFIHHVGCFCPCFDQKSFLVYSFNEHKVIFLEGVFKCVVKSNHFPEYIQDSLCLLKSFLLEVPLSTFHMGDIQMLFLGHGEDSVFFNSSQK